jgi:hypothetical protein
MVKDPRGQHVTADDGERRRRSARLRLFDDARHRRRAAAAALRLHDAPAADILGGDLHDADRRRILGQRDLDHLLHRRHGSVDQVVGEDDGERLIADHGRRAQHCVAEAERLRLPDVDAVDALGRRRLHRVEEVVLLRSSSSVSSSYALSK